MRGGIQGKEGVIGEDGALENDDEDSSADGMRTRQQRMRYRRKTSQTKTEVQARTRQGANNARAGEEKQPKSGDGTLVGAQSSLKKQNKLTQIKVSAKPLKPATQSG